MKVSTRKGGQPKKKADRATFERKVRDLGCVLDRLPAERQEQLQRELEADEEREQLTAREAGACRCGQEPEQ